MADSKTDLTFKDCSEYILCRSGDESFSRCKFTGTHCVADEAGLECSMWEEEKVEILSEKLKELHKMYQKLLKDCAQPDISSQSS